MGRLQSSIGLITGTDIVGTVDQLIALSARPRDRLLSRNREIQGKQQQIASLTASVIGVQLAGNALSSSAIFTSKSASSSNDAALSVSTADNAPAGKYTIKTLQTAATHSIASAQRFASRDAALGFTGKIVIQASGFVDDKVALSSLNGGLGVQGGSIRLTDRSGATADVDLSSARTVDDVLQAINDADVAIDATTRDGKIRLVDRSGATTSNLKVQQLGDAETAADLGLWGIDQADNVAEGNVIDLPEGVVSLRGAALSQLGGGNGLGDLTSLNIGLSDGSTGNVDVSQAGSLSEVIDAINGAGLGVIARVNDAGNGLRLRDVSGGDGNLTISSDDDTAAKLGLDGPITGDIAVGKDLNLATVSRDTKLADLNQGLGPTAGSFTIRDSSGAVAAVNLAVDEIETIGDLLDRINELDVDVTASLNENGDGIVITDNAGGTSPLTITDTGTGTVAQRLGLAGTAAANSSSVVGTDAVTIEITAEDTLDSIIEKINESGRYATASAVAGDDGQFTLQIRSKQGGEAGRIGINTEGLDLSLRTTARGQDAIITLASDGGAERFLTSTDGVFEDELTGLNLTVKTTADEPITVTIDDDPGAIVSAIKRFTDQYNNLVGRIDQVTFFNADTSEVGLLFGSTETLRIQSSYSRLLSSSSGSSAGVRSLAEIGIRLDETGKLQVDDAKLRKALTDDGEAVEKFFNNVDPDTNINSGLVGKLDRLADQFAGDETSMLLGKTRTLADQLERNNGRVESLNVRLENERERLLRQYYATEQAISRIQSNQSYASQISYIGF